MRIFCLTLFFFTCVASFTSRSQDTLSSLWAETKTLQLYNDKQWSELLSLGKRALHLGYDYYYMRMRVGTAYYEKKNYLLAEKHFKKAIALNSFDDLPKEYLYYCYIFTGRNEQARLLSSSFSKELARKTGTDRAHAVDFILLEGGTKISDSANYYDVHRHRYDNYFDPALYLQAGLGHYIKNRVLVFHAATLFKQQTFLGITRQKQYYLRLAIPFKNNWLVSPAFDVIGLSLETQLGPQSQPPMAGMPPPRQRTVTTSNTYYVGSLSIDKMVRKTLLTGSSTASNMSGSWQYINAAGAAWYLMGNSKIVPGVIGYMHTINDYKTVSFSFSPYLYLQPHPGFSLRLSYLVNQNNNIIESNGYIVNNSSDLTRERYSALATVKLSKSLMLYGLYQLEMKQEKVQLFNYKYNVILFGIKLIP